MWRHGDWILFTARGSCLITGRSDATLNRGGVRMGTAEFYTVVEDQPEVDNSLVVHLEDPEGGPGELLLFVALHDGRRARRRAAHAPRRGAARARSRRATCRTPSRRCPPSRRRSRARSSSCLSSGSCWAHAPQEVVSRDALANPGRDRRVRGVRPRRAAPRSRGDRLRRAGGVPDRPSVRTRWPAPARSWCASAPRRSTRPTSAPALRSRAPAAARPGAAVRARLGPGRRGDRGGAGRAERLRTGRPRGGDDPVRARRRAAWAPTPRPPRSSLPGWRRSTQSRELRGGRDPAAERADRARGARRCSPLARPARGCWSPAPAAPSAATRPSWAPRPGCAWSPWPARGDEEWVARLGAAEVLPRDADLSAIEPVDGVFDAVPLGPAASTAALRDGGTAVFTRPPGAGEAESARDLRLESFLVSPDAAGLRELAEPPRRRRAAHAGGADAAAGGGGKGATGWPRRVACTARWCSTTVTRFVLVHGAFAGGWVWGPLAEPAGAGRPHGRGARSPRAVAATGRR